MEVRGESVGAELSEGIGRDNLWQVGQSAVFCDVASSLHEL